MCKNCGKSSCGGCCINDSETGAGAASNLAQALAQLASQQIAINTLTTALAPFTSGHPILLVEHSLDVAQFDLGTGKGKPTGPWLGWGICSGAAYPNANGSLNITTPDLRDKVPVGAGLTYAVDTTFGADNVVLITSQLPSHTHTLTDPGHTHPVTDGGHTHSITDPEHNHATTCTVSGVTGTTNTQGDHFHGIYNSHIMQVGGGGQTVISGGLVGTEAGGATAGSPLSCNTPNNFLENAGGHSHTVAVNTFSPTVVMSDSATGISVNSATTGITNQSETTGITIAATGAGSAVDIRQKSYAVFFAMKIF